ncbi:MAG: FHA domain-containing protein, partial [Candidatus Omnitrophica bacterium]|nr:FHA domain-containing protein [Candidatus Omnitrophota bacterium]
ARLDWDGRVLKLTDLGSSNSTQVNDEDVKGERILQDGDIIQVVDYQMEVSLATPESLEATIIRPKDS